MAATKKINLGTVKKYLGTKDLPVTMDEFKALPTEDRKELVALLTKSVEDGKVVI